MSYTYNGLFVRVNNTQTTHSGQVYNRDYVIDYTSYERNDLAVDSPNYMAQKHVYTAWGERLEQFTERGNWDRLLYVHEDVMGNTMHYTKATGQSFGELRYDVWGAPTLSGKLLNNDNGNFVAATFTGHIYDTVLDIYFAEARFYDAKNRQWLSSDPIKDGLNWYQYCGSNPTTFFDPNGLEKRYFKDIYDDNEVEKAKGIQKQLPTDMQNYIKSSNIWVSNDGMFVVQDSLNSLLEKTTVETIVGKDGLEEISYYNDWYLFGVQNPTTQEYIMSVAKLRSLSEGRSASSSVPFIKLDIDEVSKYFSPLICETKIIDMKSISNVVYQKGDYDKTLANYFANASSNGSYVFADMLVDLTYRKTNINSAGYINISTAGEKSFYEKANGTEKPLLKEFIKLGIYSPKKGEKTGSEFSPLEDTTNLDRLIISQKGHVTLNEYNAILMLTTGDSDVYAYAGENAYHAANVDTLLLKNQAIKSDAGIGESRWDWLYEGQFKKTTGKYYESQIQAHG